MCLTLISSYTTSQESLMWGAFITLPHETEEFEAVVLKGFYVIATRKERSAQSPMRRNV